MNSEDEMRRDLVDVARMNSTKLLKDLRDALWHARMESRVNPTDDIQDAYTIPLDELTAQLSSAGLLSDTEARLVIGFLDEFDDPDEDPSPREVPDDVATEISRITAELRSARLAGNRDVQGFGPER
jgi:hypothetical protein